MVLCGYLIQQSSALCSLCVVGVYAACVYSAVSKCTRGCHRGSSQRVYPIPRVTRVEFNLISSNVMTFHVWPSWSNLRRSCLRCPLCYSHLHPSIQCQRKVGVDHVHIQVVQSGRNSGAGDHEAHVNQQYMEHKCLQCVICHIFKILHPCEMCSATPEMV